MDRRGFTLRLLGLGAAPLLAACQRATGETTPAAVPETPVPQQPFTRLVKTREEWRRILDDEQFQIMFEQGTERPWSSPFNDEKRPGTFVCAACFLPLFDAAAKYESGTGWPSFFRPIRGRVATRADHSLGMVRTEYHCARCGAHQGHVFEDGPPPTGLRYCNNGVALRFFPRGQALPALRT